MNRSKKYTDEDIVKNALEVDSLANLLKSLNLTCAGGNYIHLKKQLQRLSVDCSHWTGQAWNKDQRLKDWSEYRNVANLKPHLIKERGHKCERCNLKKWLDNPIPLEIDHKNGDRTDNRRENLELLCCNCHALTPTWRGRNNKKEIINSYCLLCNKKINRYSKTGKCVSCNNKTRDYSNINRKVKDRPSKEQLLKEIEEINYCAVGRKYEVSDNAVRKWVK